MTLVGAAEIIITPKLVGFAGIGAKARSELAPVGAAAGAAGAQLRGATRGAQDFGLGLGALGGKARAAAGEVGRFLPLLGAAGLVGAFVVGAKKANEFEAEMAKLSTQAGSTTREVATLTPQVLKLAQSVGIGPVGLAQGLYHLESAGFRGAEAMDLLTNAAKLARIGHADLEKTVQATIAIEASHIKGVHGAAEAMGMLNRIVGVGDMRMEGFASAMSSGIVPAAATFGMSLQDVGAAMATLTDNAIPPQEAATRLRMTFSLLGAPSRAAAKALGSIGLESITLGEDLRKPNGLLVAMRDLKSHLDASGMSAAQQAAVISRAFGGGRSSSAIMTLLGQMDRFELKYRQLGGTGDQIAGQFETAWERTQRTTSQKIAMLRGSFETFLVRLGTGTQGLQGRLAGLGTGLLDKLSGFLASGGKAFDSGPLARGLADLSKLGRSLGQIFRELGPAVGNVAQLAGGVFLAGLHALAGAFGVISRHGTLLRGVLYALVALWVANRVATTALAAQQAVLNVVSTITIARTQGMTAALGAKSLAQTKDLIGTRLLTAAYNSNLVTAIRSTVVWVAQKVAMAASTAVTWLYVTAVDSSTLQTVRSTAALVAQKTAMVASAVASKVLAAGTWLLNVAMSANPIGLIVIALAALGAGIYMAFKHVKWFREGLVAAWHGIEIATKAVGRFFARMWHDVADIFGHIVDFVKKWWPVFAIVMSGGALLIPVLILKYWRQILHFTEEVLGAVWRFVSGIFRKIYDAVSSAVSAVVGFVAQHWRLILIAITGPLGLVIVLVVNFWRQISGFFAGLWRDVSGFASRIWKDVAGFFSRMWSDVAGFASRIWKDVAGFFSRAWSDVTGFASRIWKDVAGFFSRTWSDVTGFTSRIWRDVAGFFSRMWSDVSGFASRIWHDVAGFFSNLWRDTTAAVSRAWHDVAGFFSNIWRDVTGFASRAWHDVAGFFTNLGRDVAGAASTLWRDVTGWFTRIRDDITGSVKTATGWIRAAWDGLKEIFKAPINFVIRFVYNDGIRKVWNFIAGIVHESPLPEAKPLRRGGPVTGGAPGRDSVHVMAMPGEHMWTAAEVAAAGGHEAMFALRRLFGGGTQARGRHFALGGKIIDAVTHPLDTLESIGEGTLDVLGGVFHFVRGALGTAVAAALAPVRAAISHTLGAGHDWKGLAGRLMVLPLDKIVEIARGQDKKDTEAGGGPGVERWRNVGLTALELAGQSTIWIGALLKRMNQESGGNPVAVNRSDINWQHGTPSVGLMQVIKPTFRAYAGPFLDKGPFLYGVSTDPLANVYSATKYTAARYGTLSAWNRPGGYDNGGPLHPGWTLAYNGTGRDEWVVPSGAGHPGGHVTLTVNVDARGTADPAAVEAAARRAVEHGTATLMRQLAVLVHAGEGAA